VDIRRLAFIGAQARLAELNAERQVILRAFPELSLSDRAAAATRASSDSARTAASRLRRRISAERRRRIAKAAKRRWAEWRKNRA
jgi:hypothetical protein